MPNIPIGNRKDLSVKSRAKYIKDKARAFAGMDKSNTKFYNSKAWKELRAFVLQRDPLCIKCKKNNRYITATVVDHIQNINAGGAKLNVNNLQSLCASCHNSKSSKDRQKYL